MDVAPPIQETKEEQISEVFCIKQGDKQYKLNLQINDQKLLLKIIEENIFLEEYEKELKSEEIKVMSNIYFKFSNYKELFNYIKSEINNNNLEIEQKDINSFFIKLNKGKIIFKLIKKKLKNEVIIENLCSEIVNIKNILNNMENKYNNILIENKNLKNEIENLKLINKELKDENKNMKEDVKKYKNFDKDIKNLIKEENKNIDEGMKKIQQENKNNTKEIFKLKESFNKIKDAFLKKIEERKINNEINKNVDINERIKTKKLNNEDGDVRVVKVKLNEQIDEQNKKINKNLLLGSERKSNNIIVNCKSNFGHVKNIKTDLNPFKENYNDNNKKEQTPTNRKRNNNRKYNNTSFKYINENNKSSGKDKLNLTNNLNNYTYRHSVKLLNGRKNIRNVLIITNKKSSDNLFHTYNKPKEENFLDNLKKENSDNINQYKNEEMEKNLNEDNQSTKNYGIKKRINFFENNTYKNNNKNNQEKCFEKLNYQIITYNIKDNIKKQNDNFKNNIINKNEKKDKKSLFKENENANMNQDYKNPSINSNILTKSKSFSKFSPKIGLFNNIKSLKNMDIILQCLLHIKELINYFRLNKEIFEIKKEEKYFVYLFLKIIINLDENKIIKKDALIIFKDYIDKLNPLSNNLKDLLLFILNSLHNELNDAKNINPNNNDDFDKDFDIDFHKYKKSLNNYCKSIISDLFCIIYHSKKNYLNCKFASNNFKFNNILIFPLEKIKKEYSNKKNLTIYDCFGYYQKQNYIKKICENCNKEADLANNNILMQGPKILIINIIGEKNNKKEIKFELEEKIELKNFIFDYKKEYNYELISLISIIDDSHYIAFCKSFNNNKWYKDRESLDNESMFNEIKKAGFPYLLFYSLITNN